MLEGNLSPEILIECMCDLACRVNYRRVRFELAQSSRRSALFAGFDVWVGELCTGSSKHELTVGRAIVILDWFREFIQACCAPRLFGGRVQRVAVEL